MSFTLPAHSSQISELNGLTSCYATRQDNSLIKLERAGRFGKLVIYPVEFEGRLMITVVIASEETTPDKSLCVNLQRFLTGAILDTKMPANGIVVFTDLDPSWIYGLSFS